jgi:hypothetical protein
MIGPGLVSTPLVIRSNVLINFSDLPGGWLLLRMSLSRYKTQGIHQCHGTTQTATDQITQLYRTTLVAVLPTVFHLYNLTPLIRQLAR